MNMLAIAGSAVLGVLPFIFSPTRTFARGGMWRFAGAGLLVLSMLLLFWTIRDMSSVLDGDTLGLGVDPGAPEITDADVKALEKALGG